MTIAIAALGGAVLVVAVLAVAGVFSGADEDEPPEEGFGGPTVPRITAPAAPTPPRATRIPVGGRPDSIAAGAGFVWATD